MKRLNLVNLVLAAGLALSPGCVVVKSVVTPFAAVRDVLDIPLASTATFFNYLGDSGKGNTGNTQVGPTYGRGGVGVGASMDLTYPVGKIMAGVIGIPDYLACRLPMSKSPWKKPYDKWGDFLFPNLNSLWGGSEEDSKNEEKSQ